MSFNPFQSDISQTSWFGVHVFVSTAPSAPVCVTLDLCAGRNQSEGPQSVCKGEDVTAGSIEDVRGTNTVILQSKIIQGIKKSLIFWCLLRHELHELGSKLRIEIILCIHVRYDP